MSFSEVEDVLYFLLRLQKPAQFGQVSLIETFGESKYPSSVLKVIKDASCS